MQQQNAPSVRWEWISEAWNLFTRQWSVWVVMGLVMFLAVFVIYFAFSFLFSGLFLAMIPTIPQDGEIPTAPVFPVGLFLLWPLLFLAIIVPTTWLFGGFYNTAFKQIRGEQIAVGDLFSGGRYFVRILGAVLLITIAAGIGGVLCIIPGLIVGGLTFLTYPMIVEGGKGTIDAIKASIEVTKKDWIMFTIFALVLGFIAQAGALACGIGVLATFPLLFLGQALAYRDLVGIPGAQSQGQFMPPPPAPDYRSYSPSQTPAQPQAQPWVAPTFVAPPEPEPSTKTCPHCGAVLARVVNFCNQCGRPLRGA